MTAAEAAVRWAVEKNSRCTSTKMVRMQATMVSHSETNQATVETEK